MFGFLKKLLGLPTHDEVAAAKQAEVPYKLEPAPVVNNKTGDVVDPVVVPEELKLNKVVDAQVTDAVTEAVPAKKTRKPRATKTVEKPAAKKTARKPRKQSVKKEG